MIDYLQRLGASGLATLQTLGRATVLWWQAIFSAPDWRNGPGLLFENVKGSPFPLLINAFGTDERMRVPWPAAMMRSNCSGNAARFLTIRAFHRRLTARSSHVFIRI